MSARRERKVVTVLFADLVGFTSRAESLDPEDVEAILGPYHERLRSELERYGGTVEKFIGDAVMALFGAPFAHEDDPERAVRAALAIRDWAEEEGELEVRIGITTGEALVSLDARPETGEGMASGDVVDTAARLQAARPPRHPGRRDDLPRDRARHLLRRRRAGGGEGQGRAGPGLPGRRAAGAVRGDVQHGAATPLVGRRDRARRARRGAHASAEGAEASARHAGRRPGNRQKPTRTGALPDGRSGPRADYVAAGPFAAVRRGDGVLGVGRDGERAGGNPRDRLGGGGRREAPGRDRRRPRRAGRAALGRDALAAARRDRRRGGPGRRKARRRPLPPGGASSKHSRSAGRSCWSSRISTGPTTACSTSSTTSSTGQSRSRSSSSARPGPSSLRAAPDGVEERRTRSRSRSRRSRTRRRPASSTRCSSGPFSRLSFKRSCSSAPAVTLCTPRSSPGWSKSAVPQTTGSCDYPSRCRD